MPAPDLAVRIEDQSRTGVESRPDVHGATSLLPGRGHEPPESRHPASSYRPGGGRASSILRRALPTKRRMKAGSAGVPPAFRMQPRRPHHNRRTPAANLQADGAHLRRRAGLCCAWGPAPALSYWDRRRPAGQGRAAAPSSPRDDKLKERRGTETARGRRAQRTLRVRGRRDAGGPSRASSGGRYLRNVE